MGLLGVLIALSVMYVNHEFVHENIASPVKPMEVMGPGLLVAWVPFWIFSRRDHRTYSGEVVLRFLALATATGTAAILFVQGRIHLWDASPYHQFYFALVVTTLVLSAVGLRIVRVPGIGPCWTTCMLCR